MVPYRSKELMSSYRRSIVTFPVSLRVSEFYVFSFSSTPILLTPPLVSPKFPYVPLGVGNRLLATKSKGVWLIVCAIFQDFRPMCSQSINVTDRQTDGRTGRHAIARPCIAHRLVFQTSTEKEHWERRLKRENIVVVNLSSKI